jgi:lysophospholipase L1-like esterase
MSELDPRRYVLKAPAGDGLHGIPTPISIVTADGADLLGQLGGAPAYVQEAPRVIAAQGHSIMQNPDPQNDGHANDDLNLIEATPVVAAVLQSGGKLVYGGNWAISGQTTAQVAARAGSDALAMKAAGVTLCAIMTGTNDGPDIAQYRASLTDIIDATRDAGIEPVLLLTPASGSSDSGTQSLIRLRNLAMKRVALEQGVRCVDTFSPLVSQTTGKALNWGGPGKQYMADETHPNGHGNLLLGKAIADALAPTISSAPLLGTTDPFDSTNLVPNGAFASDGSNWNVQGFSTPAVGISYVTRPGYAGKALKITRAAGDTGFTDIGQDLPGVGNGWNVGDVFGFSFALETSGLDGNLNQNDFRAQVRFMGNYGEVYGPQFRVSGDTAPGAIGRFSYQCVIPPETQWLAVRLRIIGTASYAETHYVGEVALRNLTALGIV